MSPVRSLFAEYLGTALIVSTVLGAGHMVSNLEAPSAIGLLMIALAVGSVLYGAISALAPISGAHFNPIVSLAFLLRKEQSVKVFISYVSAQVLGAISGALLANLMFEKSVFTLSEVDRSGAGVFVGEVIASFGLVLLILLLSEKNPTLIPGAVALWIFAGHIFTSSTSFANPAVTIGRVFSDAPSAISLTSVPGFLFAQLLGLVIAIVFYSLLTEKKVKNG